VARPEQAYALRTRAVLLTRPPGDAASHHAALALRGLPLWRADLHRIDVLSRVAGVVCSGGLVVHPARDHEIALVDDTRAVALPIALAQVAARGPFASAVVAADAALNEGRCTVADLAAAVSSAVNSQSARRLARFLGNVEPLSESVGETRTRLALVAEGLPVRSQVPIHDDDGALIGRGDLLVGDRVVVEFDGAGKYADDPSGASLFREKRREDRLRELGYVVVRVTWADLANPARLLARVYAALAHAQRRLA
jgi:very-short-patch-repair endonuclease